MLSYKPTALQVAAVNRMKQNMMLPGCNMA